MFLCTVWQYKRLKFSRLIYISMYARMWGIMEMSYNVINLK
jgi:hypothetical protein